MSQFRIHKVVSALPDISSAEPNALYLLRVGVGFDLYAANSDATAIHKINSSVDYTFEKVSKNLEDYTPVFNYTNGVLTSVVYTKGADVITKTLVYSSGVLTALVLSGDVPSGVPLTKTLNYTDGVLTGMDYT